jgi:hypothetical protein
MPGAEAEAKEMGMRVVPIWREAGGVGNAELCWFCDVGMALFAVDGGALIADDEGGTSVVDEPGGGSFADDEISGRAT